jgi:hypothetical protein
MSEWLFLKKDPAPRSKLVNILDFRQDHVQTNSGARQGSYPVGTGIFHREYSGQRVELTTYLYQVSCMGGLGGGTLLRAPPGTHVHTKKSAAQVSNESV